MFIVGRNVRAKVANGELIIRCAVKDVVTALSATRQKNIYAMTCGPVKLPGTDLMVDLFVWEPNEDN